MPDNNYYPTWGMVTFSLSIIALLVAIISATKQREIAEKCRIMPK